MNSNFLLSMAACVFVIVPSQAQPSSPLSDATQVLQNTEPWVAVEALKKADDLDLACTKAQQIVESDYTIENAEKLLKFSHFVSEQMSAKVTRNGPVLFEKPTFWSLSSRDTEAAKMRITLPDGNVVDKRMRVFEAQKNALLALYKRVRESRLANPSEWNKKMLNDITTELRHVDDIRCRYLSYMVISPYLYEANRQAFIARGFFNDNEKGLRNAGKVLAKGLNIVWLYQSSDNVKDQYTDVIEYLHANCEDDLWEFIRARASIIKDISNINDEEACRKNKWLILP